jgi:4-hydroxy-tetrahydrodipicolinate synthase
VPTSLGAILTAMVTPFGPDGDVDHDAAARLITHLLDHGSDGIVVCGTTGEAATLDDDEHLELIGFCVEQVGDRGTVIAGVGSNDTRHAVKLTERATAHRPDALLSVNPYYNRPGRRGLLAHYAEVVRATDLPILLYNIPQRTGEDLSNELLAELAQLDNIVGVKQANPANIAPIDGLELYAGDDDTLARVLDIGGAGGVLTGSHIFGERFARMVSEPHRRAEIHASLADVYADLGIGPRACTIKAALNLLGLDVGIPRLPYVPLDEQETSVIRELLERHGLMATAPR